MKRIHYFIAITAFVLLLLPQMSFAQETTSATDELIGLVSKAVVEEVIEADEELRAAKEILDILITDGTEADQEQAKEDVEKAEEKYEAAEKKLDTARTDAFAEQCGKSSAQIQAMRDSGMGWGKIAKECGIHPSAAGKGKGKSKDKNKNKSKGKKK